ncbi:UDP-N-acetylmuramyl pentapeptide phosphotransferase/UDP-N- acetylglucosamine-1-phosphate transferase [Rubrobacter radiotolerans]|uniref:UDP-N-acetylmuramyl pentapeptide phosphotransferase/UDP-N-acetylglucosamine-1-phosphate transferase n=1 Tax=Rubrobacter radiotolerans TaxID=42256 RepID=A0A023X0J0_RUBRA|nr:hypothetical protein [Rubrobacter radiotolerans]AHY45520.1 UDP-N-acetylmuramyl pentapeptide phosphotransferase/UDP-N- acetylglucosamine-1-phosphate transferase [Rubrobacter radiotolerans]MDX5892933.1 hypothetical protein [Rubrobacter radiotolerans]SMC02775.1 UDP-GlcNAc:undecaprenyl-phosphate GlcNAc-1-phosphate transferase [Rubrobacter radiotolerans DSM 5868]
MTVTPVALVVLFSAMLVAGAFVPLLVRFAVGRNLLDRPNTRSSHEVPTPRLGGVAVLAGAWAGLATLAGLAPGAGLEALPLAAAATFVGLVGLADDLADLHFGVKAAAQALAALGLLVLFPPPVLERLPGVLLWTLALAVGVFWIVAVCNAFNFMDGIDGITGGVVVVCALFLAALAPGAAGFLLALAGAAVGFLVWNIGPASIFLGDGGSYFAGFALAACALYAPVGEGGFAGLLAVALVFTPYLFDTAFTIGRRLRAGVGRGVFSAHREHIYQRITPEPAMHRRTSNLYYALSAVSGLAALVASGGGGRLLLGTGLAAVVCCVMLVLPGLLRSK